METEQSDLLDGGLWVSITQLAEIKGVGKPWISERVKSLESAGKIVTRAEGRSKLVNVAQYDRAVGEVGDAFKEMAAETKAEASDDAAVNSALREHQARAAQYGADLKELDLKQRLGELVPVADVRAAVERAAEAIVRVVERMPSYAESIAAAVGKDGAPGARGVLKEMVREVRQGMADAMLTLDAPATAAPAEDAGPA